MKEISVWPELSCELESGTTIKDGPDLSSKKVEHERTEKVFGEEKRRHKNIKLRNINPCKIMLLFGYKNLFFKEFLSTGKRNARKGRIKIS